MVDRLLVDIYIDVQSPASIGYINDHRVHV